MEGKYYDVVEFPEKGGDFTKIDPVGETDPPFGTMFSMRAFDVTDNLTGNPGAEVEMVTLNVSFMKEELLDLHSRIRRILKEYYKMDPDQKRK